MRIGIDFDGTIAATNQAKSDWIERELYRHIPPYLCDRSSAVPLIGEANYKRMSDQLCSAEATPKLRAMHGCQEALHSMSSKAELTLITVRRKEKLEAAREWLVKNRFDGYIQVPTSDTLVQSKLQVCKTLGITVLVDDDIRHMPSSDLPGVKGILLKPGAPASVRYIDLQICRTWREAQIFVGTIK